jgi:hypothetical protein
MKAAPVAGMVLRRQQTCLFLVCAVVLLGAGYGWGYANTYTQYYSLASVMDRETLDLDFNSRLLHFADANQPAAVRARLYQRLAEQVHYIDQILASADDPNLTRDAAASLARARAALDPPRTQVPLAATHG